MSTSTTSVRRPHVSVNPPASPPAAPALPLAPAHAALVGAMLGAILHLEDAFAELRGLELSLRSDSQTFEMRVKDAQEIAAELREHLDMLTFEVGACCAELTGGGRDSLAGHAVSLARLTDAQRSADNPDEAQGFARFRVRRARESFERASDEGAA